LLHLGSLAKKYKGLTRITAFRFENFNQQIKQSLKNGREPLVQIRKRLYEQEQASGPRLPRKVNHVGQFYSDNNEALKILSEHGSELIAERYNIAGDWYSVPVASSLVGTFLCEEKSTIVRLNRHYLSKLATSVHYSHNGRYVVTQLHHESHLL